MVESKGRGWPSYTQAFEGLTWAGQLGISGFQRGLQRVGVAADLVPASKDRMMFLARKMLSGNTW